ncbi:MAG TPA: nitroreductase/quinone reductase family protein [Galbitalea sp.]
MSGTSAWGTFLKHTLNRVTLRAARTGRGPFSIVTSVGRKTGKTYETPIIVQPTEGGFMIELTYGDRVQWYRNTRAAGRCVITYKAVEHEITGFDEVDAATGIKAFSPAQRRILTLLHRSHFVRFLT